ncbi:MAG: outer membrane protein assembly factor BamE [Rhodobiaceae bacterium]|nr:outer membrane protein assembly factor BamE [Rhodobiaceae bacterium]MCC0056424.1 outer membrane protein assembly factor BamE [Rhodobiaceae bacterium]
MFEKNAQASVKPASFRRRALGAGAPLLVALLLAGCGSGGGIGDTASDIGRNLKSNKLSKNIRFDSINQRTAHGYVFSKDTVEQVPVGASREQVEFVLGTPSTTATFGNTVYYYISQVTERRPAQKPIVVDQRVMAVYFDGDERVSRIADYGLQDGAVFDFVSRTTPTTGEENTLLKQILSNAIGGGGGG